jgi:hypothetical protein
LFAVRRELFDARILSDASDAIEQIDLTLRLVEAYPETFQRVNKPEDVVEVDRSGKTACFIGIEGYKYEQCSRVTVLIRPDCTWLAAASA